MLLKLGIKPETLGCGWINYNEASEVWLGNILAVVEKSTLDIDL